jgi:hypothetical protein
MRAPRFWKSGVNQPHFVVPGCQPWDRLGRDGDDQQWKAVRLHLLERGLSIVAVGCRRFVLRREDLHLVNPLTGFAQEAAADRGVVPIFLDFLQEKAGLSLGHAKLVAEGMACGFPQAEGGEPEDQNPPAVLGGELPTRAPDAATMPVAVASSEPVRDYRKRTSKLSRLQRTILTFIRDYDAGSGAPLEILRSKKLCLPAALSRAIRRLVERDLIWFRRTWDRWRYVRVGLSLTSEGEEAFPRLTVTEPETVNALGPNDCPDEATTEEE